MELIPRDGLSVETPRGALGRDHVCAEHLVSLAAESIAIVTTRSQAIGLWKEAPSLNGMRQPMKKPITLIDEVQPRNIQRADVAPVEGFSLVVDGHFKTHYDDQEAAQKAGAELFGRFPMLQILIYDAATKTRSPLQI